jgi:hypothetical protein
MKIIGLPLQSMALLLIAGAVAVSMPSCKKKKGCTDPTATNFDPDADKDDGSCTYPTNIQKTYVEVSGSITSNTTWSEDKIYRLNGFVRVQDGATLTIQPGTVIVGDFESKGTLIVQKGGKINANGTAQKPIIFTSEKNPGFREPGDWGGVVICGKAPNNVPGGEAELEGGYGAFHGGNDPADNSGVLRYVQINFAGIPINPNEEVNSLTMGSVGSATVIEYVQCAYGLDDAFEWFGGTVNAKYLVAYRGVDDDLDVDLGYSGNVQFALCIRDRSFADQSGSNGFEVDNDGTGSNNTPFTAPTFSNVSIIGPKKTRDTPISLQFQHGAQLRRNCKIKIHNSFITGYPYGLYVNQASTAANAISGDLRVRNTVLAGVEHWGGNGYGSAGSIFSGPPANGLQHPNNPRGTALRTDNDTQDPPQPIMDIAGWFNTASFGNQLLEKWQDAGIDPSLFDVGAPNVLPTGGSILLSGASFSGLPSFFEQVSFRGAFGTQNWTSGWCDWTPTQTTY